MSRDCCYFKEMEDISIKIWMDDVRPAPAGYTRVYDVDGAISEIIRCKKEIDLLWKRYIMGYMEQELFEKYLAVFNIEEVSCDNDLGEGLPEGYKLLDWLEATGYNIPIHIHSANPVARAKMQAIIERNGWTEVK